METWEFDQPWPIVFRLATAAILGALIGLTRRNWLGEAGLRVHLVVALGAAIFSLALGETLRLSGKALTSDPGTISEVIQGVAAGIGFLGAGIILQNREERTVNGVTAAATIWLTAAVGMAAGFGLLWLPLLGTLTWLIFAGVHYFIPQGKV